jgi:ribosomal protein S18 acetylase RimI-like enzyme
MGYWKAYNHLRTHFGLGPAAYVMAANALRHWGYLRYICYARNSTAQGPHSLPQGLTIRPVTLDEVTQWAQDPALDMPAAFAASLRNGTDFAVAAFDTAAQANPLAYAFVALGTTPMVKDWSASPPPDGAYLYKVFVREEHRGRGLNKACCTAALALKEAADRRVFTLVEASNLASRRSFSAMGFTPLGSLFLGPCSIGPILAPGVKKARFRLVSS